MEREGQLRFFMGFVVSLLLDQGHRTRWVGRRRPPFGTSLLVPRRLRRCRVPRVRGRRSAAVAALAAPAIDSFIRSDGGDDECGGRVGPPPARQRSHAGRLRIPRLASVCTREHGVGLSIRLPISRATQWLVGLAATTNC
jgi:hypothetical protein